MSLQHPTTNDLQTALDRYDRESVRGEVQTPRYRLTYRDWGPVDGTPLVFVHGLCDQARSFAMMQVELVALGYRCIGYELVHGKGDQARIRHYQHADYTRDLIYLLDHLQLDRVNLFGSSFGSTITLRSLAEQPERIRTGIIQGGFARRPLNRAERALAKVGRYWPWLMGQLPIRPRVMAKLEKPQFVGCPDEVFDFLLHCSGATPIRAAAYRALLLDRLDLRPVLPRITQPLLMLGGDIDLIVPRQWEAEVEAAVPDVRRIEFQACGHYPQYTLPKPSVVAVHEFLQARAGE